MQIAITSQNRRSITQHAGKCRIFLLYDVQDGHIRDRRLVELAAGSSFHDSQDGLPTVLSDVRVLISGSMGAGLRQRLAGHGIQALVTTEEDPDTAVSAFLQQRLPVLPHNHRHDCHHHP